MPPRKRRDPPSGREPALSHPERLIDPASGVTKQALAHALEAVRARMWPFLDGRVISILRCPEGIGAHCFFQRHLHAPPPPGIAAFTAPWPDAPASMSDVMVLKTPEGVTALVQMGAVEIHAAPVRAAHPEAGDWMVLDLDPMGLAFSDVVAAARRLRALIEATGLPAFAKITGGKGVHLVTPFAPPLGLAVLHRFSRVLAEKAAALWPEVFVATNRKAARAGRIFVDYLRNHLGASAIAPYSPRARANLPCAVPVSWSELGRLPHAQAVPLTALAAWVAARPDPWADFFTSAGTLPQDWEERLERAGETVVRTGRY